MVRWDSPSLAAASSSSPSSRPFSWTILLCRFDIRVTRDTVRAKAEADSAATAAMDLHDMSSGMADVTATLFVWRKASRQEGEGEEEEL